MTFIISNENEKLKLGTIPSVRICQNMWEMALRCHHFAYKFQNFPGGGPPDPPNERGDTPLPYQPPSRSARSCGVLRTPQSFFRTPPCWNLRTGLGCIFWMVHVMTKVYIVYIVNHRWYFSWPHDLGPRMTFIGQIKYNCAFNRLYLLNGTCYDQVYMKHI